MGWKFEVAKMFMYISFPVGIFHYFNQPINYEKWVIKTKKEYYPTHSKRTYKEVDNLAYSFNSTVDNHRLDAMEQQHKNKS